MRESEEIDLGRFGMTRFAPHKIRVESIGNNIFNLLLTKSMSYISSLARKMTPEGRVNTPHLLDGLKQITWESEETGMFSLCVEGVGVGVTTYRSKASLQSFGHLQLSLLCLSKMMCFEMPPAVDGANTGYAGRECRAEVDSTQRYSAECMKIVDPLE